MLDAYFLDKLAYDFYLQHILCLLLLGSLGKSFSAAIALQSEMIKYLDFKLNGNSRLGLCCRLVFAQAW